MAIDGATGVIIGTAANDAIRRNTGYTQVQWCVDTSRYVVAEANYYDHSGEAFKRFTAEKVEKIDGLYFVTHVRMQDLHTNHQSEMVFADLKTNQGIGDSTFTERYLRQWRR